jgi:hypothetical protein
MNFDGAPVFGASLAHNKSALFEIIQNHC